MTLYRRPALLDSYQSSGRVPLIFHVFSYVLCLFSVEITNKYLSLSLKSKNFAQTQRTLALDAYAAPPPTPIQSPK